MAMIPAGDLARAVALYRFKRGLRLVESSNAGATSLEAGADTEILVCHRERTTAVHAAVNFTVGDVEAAVDDLTRRGITFKQCDFGSYTTDPRGIVSMGDLKLAWLADNEGNAVGLNPA